MHIPTSDQPVCTIGFGEYTCNWGAHFCGLYETDAERDDMLYAFLHQGDLGGDLQIYSHLEDSDERVRREYARRYPDCASYLDDSERFKLPASRSTYHPEGTFHPRTVVAGWVKLFEQVAAQRRHVRAVADTEWALRDVAGRELLIAYEARLNDVIPRFPVAATCYYDLRKFPGKTIMGVLRTHRFTVSRCMIVENPYYDPARWLAENAPDFPPLA
jgi:hypothetical protein